MKEEIKKMRIEIDALAQLTKGLNPFKWITAQRPKIERGMLADLDAERENVWTGYDSGCVMVGEKSMGPGDSGNNYEFQALIRTDKGTFRIGSNMWKLDKAYLHKTFPGIDRNSVEINKAFDSLILAKAWLGKILGELEEETPYKNDGNRKDVKDIEPVADDTRIKNIIIEAGNKIWIEKTHIEKVDWLRQEIGKTVKAVTHIPSRIPVSMAHTNVFTHLCEARFHLGFELQRIKEKSVNFKEGY